MNIRGRSFSVDAEAAANRKLGGKNNEVKPNGNGSARLIQKQENWSLSDVVLSIDDSRNDQEFLQESANQHGFFDVSITLSSGAVYMGKGQIIGEIVVDTMEQTASLSFAGERKLSKQ